MVAMMRNHKVIQITVIDDLETANNFIFSLNGTTPLLAQEAYHILFSLSWLVTNLRLTH